MYSLSQGLNIYSKNSPFIDSAWSIIGFVPQLDLHRSSSRVKVILMSSILITTLIGIIISILMGYGFTRKISGLSNYVKSLNPYGEINFNRTNLQEIDDLMSAVELFNKSVIRASEATSKILELSLLPIGGFEINQDLGTVILTEFTYDILGLDRGALVDRDTWEQSYQLLTSSPSDEYENTFYYKNTRDGTKHWLRILERKTEEGRLGVILDVTEDIKEKLRLIKELDYDPMTRLFNRDAFRREACEAIASQPDKIGALIFSDLDNLKYINDTYGHDAGDNLLVAAGKMFQEFAKHGGIVSRISGDEFAIFLHGFNSKKEIKTIIREKFLDFRGHVIETRDGFVHRIRFSSGLAWYPQDADNIMDLMKLADYAMYEAKHRERGSLFKFDRESYDKNVYLFENSDAINRLLDEELIRFDFQPIVNSRNGQVFGFEALMRSLLEDFKSPLEIITVAETQSKLGLLEHLVFRKAMSTMDDNMQALGDGKIFINSIPSQLISKKEQKVLANKYGHLFKNIIIEITEKEGDSPKQLDEKIDFIRSQGMKLAIDDFGKGYSNEVRIISLQPNIIKIDMELIQGIHWDLDKQILVNNLKIFSKTKGIKLVAEGIENTQDLEMVIKLGVDFLQGYYIGKPVDGFSTIPADLREEILYLNKYFDTWQHPHDGKELVK